MINFMMRWLWQPIDLVSNSIVLPLECLHDFHHNQDIVDLFRGEQNVRRQKPEVGKFKPQIGELSGFELITYLSFPQWFKKSERVKTVCERYRSDFTSPELIEYLRAHVTARSCPLAAGMVRIESFLNILGCILSIQFKSNLSQQCRLFLERRKT